jgi:serine/threonine-protein kinase
MREIERVLRSPRAAGQTRGSAAPWRLALLGALLAIGGGAIWFGTRHLGLAPVASRASAAVAPRVSTGSAGVAVTELPLPGSDVPGALAAYRAGLQATRDGDSQAMRVDFEEARKLDPSFGAAYFRATQAAWNDSDTAELFRQAAERRAGLPEHEALLLDALLPCAQFRAGADHWCVERLRTLTKRYPFDAEFASLLGVALSNAGHLIESAQASRRATELDPKYALAHTNRIVSLEWMGDFDAAEAAAKLCAENAPSLGCLRAVGYGFAQRGQAEKLEATARAMLGMSPKDLYGLEFLAEATACLGRSDAAVRSAYERKVPMMPPEEQERGRVDVDVTMAFYRGDFAAARDRLADYKRLMGVSSDMSEHASVAFSALAISVETAQAEEGALAARAFLDERDALVGPRTEDDAALQAYEIGYALQALRRAGRMTKADLRAERDRFIIEWRPRLGPDYQPHLWLITYANLAEDDADAREALDALPSFNGLPSMFASLGEELSIGRVYLLAGQLDEAIPWLSQAAHACRLADVRVVEANLELGEALERKGDKDKSCAAYAYVLRRWGNAKPKSVTADEAKKRSKALGCGGSKF